MLHLRNSEPWTGGKLYPPPTPPPKIIHLLDTPGEKLLNILTQKRLLTRLFRVSLMDLGKLF